MIVSASCIVTGFLAYHAGMAPLELSAFLVVLGVGTLILGTYLLYSIYQPIHTLTDIIDSISRGDTSVDIPESLRERPDDIGELARAFDRTLVSLKLALERTAPELRGQAEELQERMTERRSHQQQVYNELPLPAVTHTDQGRVTMINDQLVDLFGYEQAELAGENLRQLYPDTDEADDQHQEFLRKIAAGKPVDMTLLFQTADNELFHADVHAKLVIDDDGVVVRVRTIMTHYE
jgi:PAS domain S-box-containing protein